MKEFSYEEIEAATGGFAAKNVVGKGSHGCVYRTRLRVGTGRKAVTVAVKRASHPQGEAKLANEIAVLAAARHLPGVVTLLGVAAPPPGKSSLLVMELMPNGSLHDLLHRSPRPPPWPRRVELALDVARALRALHGAAPRVIIHRDVKTANVLLARDGRARLADFSLAVRVPDDAAAAGAPAPAGTMGYLDPSYTEPGRLGPESDVFSFGVVLLEIVSGRKVMDMNASPSSIVAWAVPLIRAGLARQVFDGRVAAPPTGGVDEAAIARVLDVAARCVSVVVEQRPTMSEVASELRAALESAGWHRRRGMDAVERAYRRVASWGTRVRAKTTTRRSKVECTELSSGSSEGSSSRADSCPTPSSRSNSIRLIR
ncbi:serine/threonine-protein kinase-like protein At1g28390 [Lolium rigidum]|uniref:serine/threonine-protein kinase-like protein At1g28390 n=1 Tax=Lolium rigidum TaxID=89674 RepID=UPI001F5DEFD3|nr:serine/threonine-protein kinase-like protein At1g28390 [Lolium rigidum]